MIEFFDNLLIPRLETTQKEILGLLQVENLEDARKMVSPTILKSQREHNDALLGDVLLAQALLKFVDVLNHTLDRHGSPPETLAMAAHRAEKAAKLEAYLVEHPEERELHARELDTLTRKRRVL